MTSTNQVPTCHPSGHCVYMMLCADATLYTGWTTDIDARLRAHNEGRGAKYTRSRLPVRLVYLEYVSGRSEGLRREAAIKRLSRQQKEALIRSSCNTLQRLPERLPDQ